MKCTSEHNSEKIKMTYDYQARITLSYRKSEIPFKSFFTRAKGTRSFKNPVSPGDFLDLEHPDLIPIPIVSVIHKPDTSDMLDRDYIDNSSSIIVGNIQLDEFCSEEQRKEQISKIEKALDKVNFVEEQQ